MLSHVEMAPVAGGFKLFGKVITQCAESAPPVPAQPREPPARGARERDDPDERDQPMVKREAADHDSAEKQQHSGAGGESKGLQPRPRQPPHQDTAEARAAAAASSAPPLPCPRCRSRNTKFCYFNNYNVNQPRHFCKDCHRYWTAGGALRNVPVGAGPDRRAQGREGGSRGAGVEREAPLDSAACSRAPPAAAMAAAARGPPRRRRAGARGPGREPPCHRPLATLLAR